MSPINQWYCHRLTQLYNFYQSWFSSYFSNITLYDAQIIPLITYSIQLTDSKTVKCGRQHTNWNNNQFRLVLTTSKPSIILSAISNRLRQGSGVSFDERAICNSQTDTWTANLRFRFAYVYIVVYCYYWW